MTQTLHIFLKDLRRSWAEMFVSVAVTAALVGIWIGLHGSVNNIQDFHTQIFTSLSVLLMVLVPAGWWIVITRVIHAERLVGDTQFWITRPYVWNRLLSAKLLFMLAFLCVPFFIAQCIILAGAGFEPHLYVPGLLYNLLLLTGTVILPLAAIATVTSNFARMTLTLLGIFLGFIAVVALSSVNPVFRDDPLASHLINRLCFILATLAFSTAIVLQYALRRVWLSRGLLLALPVLLYAVSFLASRYSQANMDRVYSIGPTGAAVRFSYIPMTWNEGTSSSGMAGPMVPVQVTLSVAGVAEGEAYLVDSVRGEVIAPNGAHWTSPWQSLSADPLVPGRDSIGTQFGMPLDVYNKFKSLPLHVHLILALTQAHAGKASSIPMQMERFAVPAFGVCAPQTGWAPVFGQVTGIGCDSALREPQLTYISTRWSDAPCSAAPTGPDEGVLGTGWAGSLDREPAQMGISPIVDTHIDLSNNQMENGTKEMRSLCAGTLITFTQYSLVGRTQTSVDVDGFYLPKVSIEGNRITYSTTTTTTMNGKSSSAVKETTTTK
jgi:hypothetical protein